MIDERIKWIDLAKVIGIWLVVLGHMELANTFLVSIIFAFHMPLFFFISGYLYKQKSIITSLKRNFSSLIIPYITYYFLTWIWWFFVSYLRHPELFNHKQPVGEILIKPFLGLLSGVGYNTGDSTMINVPLWFLISMFVVSSLFSLIYNKANYLVLILLTILSGIASYLLSLLKIDLLLSVDSLLMALPFYVLGYFYRLLIIKKEIRVERNRSSILKMIMALIFFMSILFLVTIYNGRVDINYLKFGRNPLCFYTGGISGIVCTIIVCNLLSGIYNKLVITIAKGTLLIMGFHGIFTGLLFLPLRTIRVDDNIIVTIIVSFMVLIISIPLIRIAEIKVPILVGNRATEKNLT